MGLALLEKKIVFDTESIREAMFSTKKTKQLVREIGNGKANVDVELFSEHRWTYGPWEVKVR